MDQTAVHILIPGPLGGYRGSVDDYVLLLARALRGAGAAVRTANSVEELVRHPEAPEGRPYSVYLGFGHDDRCRELPKGGVSVIANIVMDRPEDLFRPILKASLKQI